DCAVESPSDCVHLLWRIRDFFPYDTCVCYEALGEYEETFWNNSSRKGSWKLEKGSTEECNQFRELVWNHPCERKMKDADLGTRDVIGKATCDSALNEVCLRHVSCRQLEVSANEISRSGQFSSAGASRSQQSQAQAVAPTRAPPPRPATTRQPIATTTTALTTRKPPRTESMRTTPRPVTTSWDRGRHQQQQSYARTTTAMPSWQQTTPAVAVYHSNQQRHVVPQTQGMLFFKLH
ncbi:hypothetical protein OSTOST_17015, partial [Ostertagia ostertagi]